MPLAEQLDQTTFAADTPIPRIGGDRRVRVLQLVAARPLAFRRRERGEDHLTGSKIGWEAGPHRVGGEDAIDSGELPYQLGVVGVQHLALAPLQAWVAGRQVQGHGLVPAIEQQVAVGRLDATQVVEGVGLPRHHEAPRKADPLNDGHRVFPDA